MIHVFSADQRSVVVSIVSVELLRNQGVRTRRGVGSDSRFMSKVATPPCPLRYRTGRSVSQLSRQVDLRKGTEFEGRV